MTDRKRWVAAVLLAFTAVFVALAMFSYTQKSATWDEPIHVTTGYLALSRGDYRTDPEHPPFLRMWAALPIAHLRLAVDQSIIDRTPSTIWASATLFPFTHKFMYLDNDADQLLYRARFMIVILGVLLGMLVFAWAYEWLGPVGAMFALVLYTLEPNLAAHATLVTTDFGVTCFLFGAVYFLWRTMRQHTRRNVAGLIAFSSLTIVSKFSGLIVLPIGLGLLAIARVQRALTTRQAITVAAGLLIAGWVSVWAAYGFRYAPSESARWLFHLQDNAVIRERVPTLANVVGALDDRHVVPNTFAQGFLLGQAKAQRRSAFLAGEYSMTGWWYYFPVAWLLKTPMAMIVLAAAGLAMMARRKAMLTGRVYVLLPPVTIMTAAMMGRLNIGMRHVLPMNPFVILLAAAAAVSFARHRALRIVLSVLVAWWLFDFVRVYPNQLTFFNQLAGGPAGGYRYLTDSNVDWGQDLKPLKAWMTANQVPHVNLAYFGTADPAYYGINCTYLPGSPGFVPADSIALPQLPGYVAVSATILSGVYLNEIERAFYKPLLDLTPTTRIGNSILVYRLERPWWTMLPIRP